MEAVLTKSSFCDENKSRNKFCQKRHVTSISEDAAHQVAMQQAIPLKAKSTELTSGTSVPCCGSRGRGRGRQGGDNCSVYGVTQQYRRSASQLDERTNTPILQ